MPLEAPNTPERSPSPDKGGGKGGIGGEDGGKDKDGGKGGKWDGKSPELLWWHRGYYKSFHDGMKFRRGPY